MVNRSLSSFLHVANGTGTTRLFEAAGIPGAWSIWADVLHEGPVPGNLADAELVNVRTRFLAPADQPVDPVNDLTRWRTAIAEHEEYGELVLWYEHDLFDQLNLIQLLPWIHERLPKSKTVSMICIGSFPGRPNFKGLGELTPRELGPLLHTRQPVTREQYGLAERAWNAFRSPTPEALEDLLQQDTSALPFLSAALRRFLQEYPWTTDGLSRTERRLLQLANDGTATLLSLFPRMHEGETAYYIADGSLMETAETLSRTSPALLTMDGGPGLNVSVKTTDAGRQVLAGQQDRVEASGIDRWFGGVHLQGKTGIWRWDDSAQRIVAS